MQAVVFECKPATPMYVDDYGSTLVGGCELVFFLWIGLAWLMVLDLDNYCGFIFILNRVRFKLLG
jgi:hypothetical protein